MKRKVVAITLGIMVAAMGAGVTVSAMPSDKYSDVTETSDSFRYISRMYDEGIMDDVAGTVYGVDASVSRESAIEYLYKMAKSPEVDFKLTFADNVMAEKEVQWAMKSGLFTGMEETFFTDNKFNENKKFSREEFVQVAYNFYKNVYKLDAAKKVAKDFKDFEDGDKVTKAYEKAMLWAVGNGYLSDRDGDLVPNKEITRAEMAEMLSKMMNAKRDADLQALINSPKTDAVVEKSEESVEATDASQKVTTKATNQEGNVVTDETTDTKDAVKPDNSGETTPDTNKPDNGSISPDTEKPDSNGSETPDVEQSDTETPDVEVPDNGNTETPDVPDKGDIDDSEKPHNHNWVDNKAEVKHEEKGHWEKVEVKPAWVENIKHDAEYTDKYVVDKEAQYDTVHHDAEYADRWVVDKEAWVEEVPHAEEGHFEQYIVTPGYWEDAMVSPEEGHMEDVVISPAWDEQVQHDAVYETQDVVITPAWDEPVYEYRLTTVCSYCGYVFPSAEAGYAHIEDHAFNDGIAAGYHEDWRDVQVDTIHHAAITEPQQVLVKDAWTETISHPAETESKWVVDKEAVYDKKWNEPVSASAWVVDKEARVEKITHKEEGHYENVKVKDAWDEEVLVSKEQGHTEKVLIKEAWTETIQHEAEYEDQYIIDQAAYSEWVVKGEICSECGETR